MPWAAAKACARSRRVRTISRGNWDNMEPFSEQDGDAMDVESSVGKIRVRAHVTAQILRGVVRIPQGGGHTAFGRHVESATKARSLQAL